MNRVPNEVDELMWGVAESADPEAIAQFGARYPDCRIELARRIAMVESLKSAGKRAAAGMTPPSFEPRTPQVVPLRPGMWLAAAVALVGLAYGSYVVTSKLTHTQDAAVDRGASLTVSEEGAVKRPPPPDGQHRVGGRYDQREWGHATTPDASPPPDQKPVSMHIARANLRQVYTHGLLEYAHRAG